MIQMNESEVSGIDHLINDVIQSCMCFLNLCLQDHADVGTSTRQSHLHGVAFPINQDALDALEEFREGRAGYVQLVGS